MERTEVKITKGLTPKSLGIGIVLTLFSIFYFGTWGEWTAIGAWHPFRGIEPKDWWPMSMVTDWGAGQPGPMTRWADSSYGVILFLAFVPALISALLPEKYRLSMNELAFIYAMTTPAAMLPTMYSGIGKFPAAMASIWNNRAQGPPARQYISSLLSPKDAEILGPMSAGKAVVPWGEWTVPIAFWITACLSMYFFQVFIAMVFRRMYIDVEALNFPLARTTYETLSLGTAESKPRLFTAKWLWIGTLIGALVTLSASINNLYPSLSPLRLSYDLTPYVLTQSELGFFFAPANFGIGLILPMDVTFTQVVSYIFLYLIMPPILVSMGQLNQLEPGHHAHWVHNRWINLFEWAPFSFFHMGWDFLGIGVMFGIAIWPIIIHREELIESIRATTSGESILDRIQWIGLIASGAVQLGLWIAIGSPFQYAALMLIVIGLVWMSIGRVQAECGGGLGAIQSDDMGFGLGWEFFQTVAMNAGMIGQPEVAYPTMGMVNMYMGARSVVLYQTGWFLDQYKIGEMTKTRDVDLFVSQSLGGILSVAITIPVAVWLYYTLGFTGRNFGVQGADGGFARAYELAIQLKKRGTPAMQPNEGTYTMLAVGFIIVVALNILRARFAGPFSLIAPAGIYLAIQWGLRWWFPFLVATIAKAVVTRVGGTKLYSSTMIPLGVGLILGWALIHPVAALSQILIGLGYRWW